MGCAAPNGSMQTWRGRCHRRDVSDRDGNLRLLRGRADPVPMSRPSPARSRRNSTAPSGEISRSGQSTWDHEESVAGAPGENLAERCRPSRMRPEDPARSSRCPGGKKTPSPAD